MRSEPEARDRWESASRPPGAFSGIRTRIFLLTTLLAVSLLAAVALVLERQAGRELEGELTLKLQAVGQAAGSLIGPGFVPALLHLAPSQSDFPFYQDRRRALVQLRDLTGVRRIFLADTLGRSYVDTDSRVPIGASLPQMRSDRVEVRRVRGGSPAAAELFTDADGQVRKTGYVPVMGDGAVLGIIGVEGDATFLAAVRSLRRRMFLVGAAGVVLAFLMAGIVSRTLTRPIAHLVAWARRLGSGDLSRPVPVRGRDEIAFLAGTLEQMRRDLETRDREQRAMVAGVAHEIRNPLGGIRLYADLLEADGSLGHDARARLEKIRRELDHLGAVVDEFLLYARPAVPDPHPTPIADRLPELVERMRPTAEASGVRLELEGIDPDGGRPAPCIAADATHLEQILRNLIRNAVEASPAEGTVVVRLSRESGDVRIEVTDQGAGLSDEVKDRLFEPFFTTKPDGAGLGLAIVRRLTHLNGGRVEVASGPIGARFAVVFKEERP